MLSNGKDKRRRRTRLREFLPPSGQIKVRVDRCCDDGSNICSSTSTPTKTSITDKELDGVFNHTDSVDCGPEAPTVVCTRQTSMEGFEVQFARDSTQQIYLFKLAGVYAGSCGD